MTKNEKVDDLIRQLSGFYADLNQKGLKDVRETSELLNRQIQLSDWADLFLGDEHLPPIWNAFLQGRDQDAES